MAWHAGFVKHTVESAKVTYQYSWWRSWANFGSNAPRALVQLIAASQNWHRGLLCCQRCAPRYFMRDKNEIKMLKVSYHCSQRQRWADIVAAAHALGWFSWAGAQMRGHFDFLGTQTIDPDLLTTPVISKSAQNCLDTVMKKARLACKMLRQGFFSRFRNLYQTAFWVDFKSGLTKKSRSCKEFYILFNVQKFICVFHKKNSWTGIQILC